MQSKACTFLLLILAATMLLSPLVVAKPSIDLSFYKDNGYGFGDDIGGLWTITAHVSSDVQYVEFYLDNQLQQNDTSTPFTWQFNTSNYTSGQHALKAVAYDSQGETAFQQVTRNFQQTSTETVTTTIIAITAAVIVVIVLVVAGLSLRKSRSKKEKGYSP
jgi:hypothetical protein